MERNTVIKTYSLDQKIAEKFTEQTPKQKTSEELEKIMAEYIDEDIEDRKQPIKVLDRDVTTKQRRKIVELVVENDWWNKSGPQIHRKVKSKGYYQGDSGSHHFKEGIRFLDKLDGSGLTRENGKTVPEQFICMNEGCDAGLNLKILSGNGMECLTCGRRYEI